MPFLVKGKIGLWPGRVREPVSKDFYLFLCSCRGRLSHIMVRTVDIKVNKLGNFGYILSCQQNHKVLAGFKSVLCLDTFGSSRSQANSSWRRRSRYTTGRFEFRMRHVWCVAWVVPLDIYKGWRVRASWLYRWCVFLSIATVATVEVVWPKVPLIDQYR